MGKKKLNERPVLPATSSAFDHSFSKKKKRVKWTTELHEIFMEVLQKLGDKGMGEYPDIIV